MKCVVLTFILACSLLPLAAQDLTPDPQQLTDEVLATQEHDLNYDEAYENLTLLLSEPLDINKATEEELRFIPVLSDYQINELITYRKEHGNLLSVHELQSVPGFDLPTIRKLLPFVTVTDPLAVVGKPLIRRMLEEKNNYLLTRYERTVEQKTGFSNAMARDAQFAGSPDKLYVRFRTSRPGDFSMGFTTEKDAGERIRWQPGNSQFGFDFYSFHVQLQNKGSIRNIIAGDYLVQAGQGLILGSVFGLGKGGETILATRKSNIGLLPYTSANESGFMRGAGMTYQLRPRWLLTAFYSRIKNDAVVASDSADASAISSFQTTGLHRNEKELSAKNNIIEQNTGCIINYRFKRLDAGAVFHTSRYSEAVHKKTLIYNQFTFAGETSHNSSLFANYSLNNVAFFSEIAASENGGAAAVAGILGSLHPRLDISLVYRNYARTYHAPYANAFGENTATQNERGLYCGWKYRWNRKATLSGYADLFYFPWLRFRSYAPSEGHEWMLRFSYEPGRTVACFIQIREENKTRNDSRIDLTTYPVSTGVKRNYLFHIQYAAAQNISLRTRIQGSTYAFNGTVTEGIALWQDVRWEAGRFSVTARHALFDTEDYDNRQYAFENDVRLAFSVVPYYGRGARNYAVVEYTFNDHVTLWLRYARTRYVDKTEIGSGLDAIASNTRRDIKVQLMIRL